MSTQTAEASMVQNFVRDAQEVAFPEPSDCLVDLPGGWLDSGGTVHHKALIRELTGADEEALSRATKKGGNFDPGIFLGVALQRSLVSIDGIPADDVMRNSLLIGDRDAILLGVRIATYGGDYETSVTCSSCGKESGVVVELEKDVQTRKSEASAWWRNVPLRKGEAILHLVTVADQTMALSDDARTGAEVDTIIMSRVVKEINGAPVLGERSLLEAPAGVRRSIAKYLVDNQPGPQLGEVKGSCPACKADINISLSLPALFL